MVIDQRLYRSDLMIYPDGSVADTWRRAAGHRLQIQDIQDMVSAKPDIIVVGTGIYGLMRPNKNLVKTLADQGIELVAIRTKAAAQEYNRLKQSTKRVAACFHLT